MEERAVPAGRGWFGELARVVVPVQCAGCGALDLVLCAECRTALRARLARCEGDAPRLDRLDGRPPLPVWARAAYDGPVRELVLAWKDRGRTDLTAVVHAELGAAVGELAPTFAHVLDGRPRDLLVIGAPSSRAAVRRRGADLVAGLAGVVAAALADGGVPARTVAALEQRRGARDQAGLGARARGRNLSGRIRVRAGLPLRGRAVVVVDDVLTTGATLAGAVAALERAGALLIAGIVLAATPRPARTSRDEAGTEHVPGADRGTNGW